MYKYLIVLLLLASTVQGLDNQILMHEDVILDIYNSSCIETANYLYLFINNTQIDMNKLDSYDNRNIIVMNIKELGPNSIFAKIEFL